MRRFLLLVLVVVLAACHGEATDTSVSGSDSEPAGVVSRWLDALAEPDTEALQPLVEPIGLAVVAAVTDSLRSEELVGLLTEGLGDELATEYWTAFRDDFAAIQGEPISAVKVGDVISIPDHDDYVAVAVSTDTSNGQVILHHTEAGWQLDFAATLGPALVGPLGEYLESAVTGEHAQQVATAYAEAIIPGLEAAAALDPANRDLVFETEYLRQLAGGVI